MVMIKFFASILIGFPIITFGFYKSYKDDYRKKDLQELYKALNILKYEIDYSFRTLDEAFYSISTKVSYPINDIFYCIYENMKSEVDMSLTDIFNKSIDINRRKTFLSKKDLDEFLDLSKTINHLNENAINGRIDIFMDYINTELSLIQIEGAKNKKLYQTLSILSSILVIIILL